MPNYCRTYLRISVDPWDLKDSNDAEPTEEHKAQAVEMLDELRELVSGKYAESEKIGAFVFHQVLPRPIALDGIVSGSTIIGGEEVHSFRDTENGPVKVEGLSALLAEHGATNWYDWNRQNWGTKWDTTNVLERHDLAGSQGGYPELNYQFQTAWSPPEPVISALRSRYPKATCQYFWCEEGGCSGGDDAYWILERWTMEKAT